MNEQTKNVFAVMGVGGLLYFMYDNVKNTITNNVNITLGNPTLDKQFYSAGYFRLDVPITIQNNNIFDITFSQLRGVVTYGNLRLANVSMPYNNKIPNNTIRTFNLNVDIPITSILTDLANAFNYVYSGGSIFDLLINKIELSGHVVLSTGLANVPVNFNKIAIPIV